MGKIIYPWNAKDIKVHRNTKAEIFQEMRSRYPGVLNMPKPNARVVRVVTELVDVLIDLDTDEDKVPWVVACSTSSVLLQALAKLVPATLMLTKLLRAVNVTTDRIISLFRASVPRDDFDPDPAGEALHMLETHGILVWEGFTDYRYKGDRWELNFAELLGKRLDKRKMTLFLSLVPAITTESMTTLYLHVEQSMGQAVMLMIKEVAIWKHYKVPLESEMVLIAKEV